MKIRNGFVSNSSSSSFLIYGTELDEKQEKSIVKKAYPNENYDDEPYDYIFDAIEKLDKNLELFSQCEGEYFYIGLSWDQVQDDETGRQFKDRVIKHVSNVLDKKTSCETIKGE